MYERKFTYTSTTHISTAAYAGNVGKRKKTKQKNCRNKFQGLLYFKRAPRRGNNTSAQGIALRIDIGGGLRPEWGIDMPAQGIALRIDIGGGLRPEWGIDMPAPGIAMRIDIGGGLRPEWGIDMPAPGNARGIGCSRDTPPKGAKE